MKLFRRNLNAANKLFGPLNRHQSSWNHIVKQAESTVGYSTSFLNLRWLLTDEIASLASHVNKLIGTNHPILKTAKRILTKSDTPSWGLIVLLVSKAGGINKKVHEFDRDTVAGILHTQRMIAEVTEMVRTGIFFHNSLQSKRNMTPEIHQGNKIALLIGDYLITKSYQILAEINNSEVEEIISSALRELCEAEFIGERDEENEAVPSVKYIEDDGGWSVDQFSVNPLNPRGFLGKPTAEWSLRNTLGGASLLGKGCLSAIKLGGQCKYLEEKSFSFGVNLALACQARQDLLAMDEFSSASPSKVSAPVLFHLEYDNGFDCVNATDDLLRKTVSKGPGIEKTHSMLNMFVEKAVLSLEDFPDSQAKTDLYEIAMNV